MTNYFFSLPANRAQLWFILESDRLRNPVLREFYSEREVVMEVTAAADRDPAVRHAVRGVPPGRVLRPSLRPAGRRPGQRNPGGEPAVGPEGTILFMHNNDKPGVIGAIGKALGSKGINIAKMHLSRQKIGGVAISLIHVDEPVNDAVLRSLSKVQNIISVQQIAL